MSRIPFLRPTSEPHVGRRLESEAGQTLSEYTVVIAAIAVVCVAAVVVLAAAIGGRFDSPDGPAGGSPFTPPAPQHLAYPTTLDDCEHGRWKNYAQFESEEECKTYVEQHTP